MDINGKMHYSVPSLFVDDSINQVKFKFTNEEFGVFDATLTSPIIVQFIEDKNS